MKGYKKQKKCAVICVLVAVIMLLAGCEGSNSTKVTDYNNPDVTIVSEAGDVQMEIVKEYYPDANILYSDTYIAINDLLLGRYDGILTTRQAAETIVNQEKRLVIDETQKYSQHMEYCAGIVSDDIPDLAEQFNEFIASLQESGELDDIISRWLNGEYEFPDDLPVAENPDFKLRIGTTGLAEPATFVVDGEPAGYDVEIARRFAAYLNAEPVITLYDWNGLFALAESGREDFLISNMFRQSVLDSMEATDPYYISEMSLVVRGEDSGVSIIQRLHRNLIEENRWKDLLSGFGMTLLITIVSVVLGTIIGFFISLLKLWGPKCISTVYWIVEKIVTGLPLVIILMYSYYVIFKSSQNWQVAIFAFTLSFTISASTIISSGIGTVSRGQWEGAQALGFNKWKTFISIIMPQAMPFILTPYVKAIVGLLLMTSVCGYVAIYDITYAAQMIRARTYDALVPLTVAAIVYFICSCLIFAIFDFYKKRLNKRYILSAGLTETDRKTKNMSFIEADRTKSIISAKNITKAYEAVVPIKDLSFDIYEGDVVSIIGPSGTGKSTLIRMINGLENTTAGTISVGGATGMVFQDYNLFNHMTVIDNVMYAPMKLNGMNKQDAFNDAMKLLRLVGLSEKARSYPNELSGGQKQRAAIARTLAMQPDIILFDEPTSALDPTMVWEVEEVIRDLAKANHTMIIVTHSMSLAKNVSNRIFYLDEGGIYEDGTPEHIFSDDAKPKTRAFIYSLKTLEISISGKDYDFISIMNEVANFCEKERMSRRLENRIISTIEELCAQIIMKELKVSPKISGVLEYKENAREAVIYIKYNGELYNPLDSDNDLALSILLNNVVLEHEKISEEDYTNMLKLTIKDKKNKENI